MTAVFSSTAFSVLKFDQAYNSILCKSVGEDISVYSG